MQMGFYKVMSFDFYHTVSNLYGLYNIVNILENDFDSITRFELVFPSPRGRPCPLDDMEFFD
jgi:hypothetical protein